MIVRSLHIARSVITAIGPHRSPLMRPHSRISSIWLVILLSLAESTGCETRSSGSGSATAVTDVSKPLAEAQSKASGSPIRFRDILKETKIDFVQVSGMTDQKLNPTANGSGVGI